MSQQLTYTNNPPAALAGMVVGMGAELILSKVAQGTVGIGLLAMYGTDTLSVPAPSISLATSGEAGQVIQITTGSDPVLATEYLGIPILDTAKMADSTNLTTVTKDTFTYSAYADKVTVPVMRKGRLWVYSADAVAAQGGNVYVYTTAETGHPLGQFGYGTGTGKSAFPFGRYLMTTGGAGLVQMEIW